VQSINRIIRAFNTRKLMSDEMINRQLSIKTPLNQFRDISPTFESTKRRSLPRTPRH
jgi:hypothetical protein